MQKSNNFWDNHFEKFFLGYCFFSVFINFTLSLMKFFYGKHCQSQALIADAVHSLSDSFSSVIILVGWYTSEKPPDKKHPFGHGRVNLLVMLGMSVFLVLSGYKVFKESVHILLNPHSIIFNLRVFFFILSTLLMKEILAQMAFFLHKVNDNLSLKMDGYHHRFDMWSSCLVLVAFIFNRYNVIFMDGLIGIILSLWLMRLGFQTILKTTNHIIGEAPTEEELNALIEIALFSPEVNHVHDIIFHKYGKNRLVSMHIEIPEQLSFSKVHAITEQIEQEVKRQLDILVVIHTDPINFTHPLYNILYQYLENLSDKDNRVESFYSLRIMEREKQNIEVIVDISLKDKQHKNKNMIKKEWTQALEKEYTFVEFVIQIAPYWAYTPSSENYFFKKNSSMDKQNSQS